MGREKTRKVESEKVLEESDVDMSSMSEDIDEGYLSEGEVFVPKKRSKKETSNQSGSQETIAADEKHSSSTRDEKKDIHGSEQQPLSKKKKKTQKNKVCHLWLKRKCLRGKHCKYLHKKEKPQTPKAVGHGGS